MRLIYNSDAQRLQKNFDDKTPVTVSELFRSERTASVPIELFLVDNDGGYATPGSSDYEVLIGRQAQAVTTGKLTLTFTGTTEEIDLSKPKLATRIEAALNAVSEVNAAGGVDVVELKNGRAFQITFRSVGSRAAITAGVKDSMQPASVLISEVTAGTGSTREVQLLTLEEASLAEVSTSGWSANSNPALTITTLVEGTANTREVVQLSVSNDPAPGSFFVVSNSEPISTEATAAQVKTILNSALSNDIGSVKKTGERIWQITYKTNGDKTALSAGTHNLVKRPSVNATLSLNTTALAYAANSDGSDLSVGFTLKKSNEVLLSENVDLAEPFAEVIGSSAMLNNDSLGALFTIAGDDVNKGTAISLSGGLTYSSDTLAAPFLPLAGGTMTGDAVFNDGVKAIFGTSSDGLEILHDGSNSIIKDSGTGDLIIQGSDDIWLRTEGGQNYARFAAGGSVELRYANSKKFETTNTGATISGKLIVNGDLDVSGTTTTFNSTVVTVDDPVFTVGGDTAPVASDNKDRGIEFRYFRSGESAKVGFFGYDNSLNVFTFLTDATNNSEVFSGTLGNFNIGKIQVASGTASFPSFRFGDDLDTGIYRASEDNLAFTTGGTEAARFDSSGKFIAKSIELDSNGADSPTLKVAYDANNYLEFAHNRINGVSSGSHHIGFETGGTQRARLDSTGLGIGGTPSYPLVVKSTSASHQVVAVNRPDSDTAALFLGNNSGLNGIISANNSDLLFGKDFGNTFFEGFRLDTNGHLRIGNGTRIYLWRDNNQNYLNYNTWLATTGAEQLIENNGTGGIHLKASGTDSDIIFSASDGTLNELLRLDGSASSINVPDEVDLKVGSGGLSMEHKSNNETWSYYSSASGHAIYAHGGQDKDFIFKTTPSSTGSQTELLRLDGSASSINVPDDVDLKFGDGQDYRIKSDSGELYHRYYNLNVHNKHYTDDKNFIWYTSRGGTTSEVLRLDGSASSVDVKSGLLNLEAENDSIITLKGGNGSGDSVGYIDFYSRSGTKSVARIESNRDSANNNGLLAFLTTESSGSVTERMRIDQSGNVGIGGTASKKLHVKNGSSGFSGSFNTRTQAIIESDNSLGTALTILNPSSGNGAIYFGDNTEEISGQIGYFHTGDIMQFVTGATLRMSLNSTGLGIGGTPSAKLHVFDGDIRAENRAFFAGRRTESAPSFSFHDDSDTGMFNVASNILAFATSGSEAMRIDSSGRLGLGETTPASYDGEADDFIIKTDGNTGMTIATSSTGKGSIFFADGISGSERYQGNIRYFHSDSTMRFATGAVERFRISSNKTTLFNGALELQETTTPTADANFGKIYCKSDNKLYFQDGAGTEHEIAFV